jgi:hypothetical protein
MAVYLDYPHGKLYAWVSGAWVNLSADVMMTNSVSGKWGINGYKANDLVADTGTLRFTLNNKTGKYYPDGPAPLAGWGRFVPVALHLIYGGVIHYYRFYVDKIDLVPGKVVEQARVSVTCLDWMDFSNRRKITAPNILINVTADVAVNTILNAMPAALQPRSREIMTGENTFLSVFDNIGMKTTAYTELAKLANSEWAYCYVTQGGSATSEVLVFENSSHRNASHPIGQVGTVVVSINAIYRILDTTGESRILDTTGEERILDPGFTVVTAPGDILITPETGTPSDASYYIDDVDLLYGENIVNKFTVEAIPKRVDTEDVILYSLGNPIPIAAGETLAPFRAHYTDPSGGNAVNAIVSTMLTPAVPGAADPYLMTLLHFTSNMTDSTGRHTWVRHDGLFVDGIYEAPGHTATGLVTWIAGGVVGPYIVFGGYGNYYISVPPSADFNFGTGKFSVGWWECRLDAASGDATMTTNLYAAYPGMLLGRSNGDNLLIYMSSNGTSWDIANGKKLGPVKTSKWAYYEICRDSDGWFYAFSDGQLTDAWHSPLAIQNSGRWSVGKINGGAMTYMGFDELFVKKGECLHKKDFTPPIVERRTTLLGDYQMNTSSTGIGTDLSATMSIVATYGTEAVTYSGIHNGSASAGFVTMVQARGRGVYSYSPIEDSAEDATSQDLYECQALSIRQSYQQDTKAGMVKATAIVAGEKNPHTDLVGISFVANRSVANMNLFLQADIGTLMPIRIDSLGVLGNYYIQNKNFTLSEGGLLRYHFGLREDYKVTTTPGGTVPAPFDEPFFDTGFAYTWAAADLTAAANTGTIANPGNVLLSYGTVEGASYAYSSGATAFTWADVDTVTFLIQCYAGAEIYVSAPDETVFLGLLADSGPAKIGFTRYCTTTSSAKIISANGCDGVAGNEWATAIFNALETPGYYVFTIRRISATSAAWSYNGGAEQIFTGALPADGDTMIPVFIFKTGTYSIRSRALIDRITVTKVAP